VIGANIPAMQEVINDGVDGFLVPFDDVYEIKKKIDLIIEDQELRTKLGLNGFNKVMKNNTWRNIANQTREIYQKYII
jgi:glycosyltransferase involved in cell wall biosynthesis